MENISDSDWQAARDELTKAAALGVTRSEVYENLGYADYKLKQKAQSAADYQKALEIDANNATATQNLAVLQSGDDLTWVPQTVDPWTQQMRDLDASYQGDVAAGLAIRDGGRAPVMAAPMITMTTKMIRVRRIVSGRGLVARPARWRSYPGPVDCQGTFGQGQEDLWRPAPDEY